VHKYVLLLKKIIGVFSNDLYFIILPIFNISQMVFFIIGLGLGDPEDISIKALNAIRSCK
jgi:hypothetical protein